MIHVESVHNCVHKCNGYFSGKLSQRIPHLRSTPEEHDLHYGHATAGDDVGDIQSSTFCDLDEAEEIFAKRSNADKVGEWHMYI